jgi:hypothetical protein
MTMTRIEIDLPAILAEAGVLNIRVGEKEIAASCPMHYSRVGHIDRHASWSINQFSYLHNCFSCNYSGTLTQLLVDLTGTAPPDLEEDLKRQTFLSRMAEPAQQILEPVVPLLTDWALVHILLDVPQRLLDLRFLRRPAVDYYGVRWDPDDHRWVIPIRDPWGDLLGAQYRQKGAVFTLPEGIEKSTTLFGYREMQTHDAVALVESPLDAIRLYGLGIPAVSSFGAWLSVEQVKLLARSWSVVYVALDNDKTGRESTARLAPSLARAGCAPVIWRYDNIKDKDLGDAEDGDVLRTWHLTSTLGL